MTKRSAKEDVLFPSDAVIAERLGRSASEFQGMVPVLERAGFPRIDPMMRGRYWPAVKAWFDRRYGLHSIHSAGPMMPDGMENHDAI